MKKFTQITLFLVGILLLGGITTSQAITTGTTTTGYNEPTLMNSMNFTAVLKDGAVHTAWTPYAPSGFNYYKVIRSTTNPNPVYPDDSYIKADGNPDASGYTDYSPKPGVAYYRVCSIAKPNRYCSNVVTIENSGDLRICTADYSPVCGKDGKTYSNKCNAGDTPIAYAGECKTSIEPATLTLSGTLVDGKPKLTWTADKSCPKGFKIAKSTVNKNPTYPVMSGDSYRYISDPNAKDLLDEKIYAGKTYHYRVCQYNGAGECISYSNQVSLTIPGDFVATYKEPIVTTYKEATTTKEGISDITYHKYNNSIEYLLNKKIVQGYDDGTFKPDAGINRAEFTKMIIGAKVGQEVMGSEYNCFRDVASDWYAPYVCYAKKQGILSGYPDGTFKPAREINFVEAAKILSLIYGLEVSHGSAWYEGFVKALQEDNYIPPTVGYLEKPVTRGEVAEMIWRIKEQIKNQESTKLMESSK